MRFELAKHAQKVLDERGIRVEWLEQTLSAPELVLPDPEDAAVERRFRRIPEFGGRVLRVAVNTAKAWLSTVPPGRSPRPLITPFAQRKAS